MIQENEKVQAALQELFEREIKLAYEVGAHETIDRMIKMFMEFKTRPIRTSMYSYIRLAEISGEQYISVSNLIKFLQHHRDGQKHGTKLPSTEGRELIGRNDQ